MRNLEMKPEGMVELGDVECCALTHAFATNATTLHELSKEVSYKEQLVMLSGMQNTRGTSFFPSEHMMLVYGTLAKNELQRLSNPDKKMIGELPCAHGIEDHRKALEVVTKQKFPIKEH